MNKDTSSFLNLGSKNLKRRKIKHISFNIGIYCNQECVHCHLKAGTDKKNEVMGKEIIGSLKDFICYTGPASLEITGGAPELNNHLIELIEEIRPLVRKISMRTNLTAMHGQSWDKLMRFLYDREIELVASLPCYKKDRVDGQRGKGVFEKSIDVLGRLNDIGFGVDKGVPIILVYNPPDFSLPPLQSDMQRVYRKKLTEPYGVEFTDLVTMINVPVGRFAEKLKKEGFFDNYMNELKSNYNPANLSKLMCLDQVTVDWRGRFYDCDFNLALDLPHGGWSGLDSYRKNTGIGKDIYTGYHCYSCTAGAGSSCHGSLT